jgi:hypothetical protein
VAKDHRITHAGLKLDFSCTNACFRTNVKKGQAHGSCPTKGSVFGGPLVHQANGGFSLWLEHVENIESGDEMYWLMWYDAKGFPTMPMSGVFDRDDIKKMVALLSTEFLP